MIQITFNIDSVVTRPDPSEVAEDLSQIFAGNIMVVDIIVLDEPTKEWPNLPA